jgi:hypothetical protein
MSPNGGGPAGQLAGLAGLLWQLPKAVLDACRCVRRFDRLLTDFSRAASMAANPVFDSRLAIKNLPYGGS